MLIRPAKLDDARAVAEVQVAAWYAAYRGIIPDDYLQSLSVERRALIWRQSIEKGTPDLWIAADGPEVLGWIAFGQSRDSDKPSLVGEVWALYVSPPHWSRGIGRELWLTARARLRHKGFQEATLWVLKRNERALRFYRAAGFYPNELSVRNIKLGSAVLAEIRYETILPDSPWKITTER